MNERLFSDEIRARERRRRRRDFVWNVVSFVLHVIVFGAIVLLTPVKSLVFEEKAKANPAAELSADRIEQIADALSQARVNELLRQLDALQTVLHNMDLMKEQLQKDYDSFAEKSSVGLKDELSKMVDEAEKAQGAARAEQNPMIEMVGKMLAEERMDLTDETRSKWLRESATKLIEDAGDKIADAQARAGNALDRIQVRAQFGGYRKTAEAAAMARDAQIEVATMQNQAQKEASEIGYKMSEMRGRVNDLANHEKSLSQQRERLEKAEQDRSDAEEQAAEAAKRRDSASQARDAALAEERRIRDESGKATAEAKAARAEAARLGREFNNAKKLAEREQRRRDNSIRTAEDARRRIADLDRKVAERRASVRNLEDIRRQSVTDEQVKKLERAAKTQEEIRARIDVLRKVLESDEPELRKLAQEGRAENKLVTTDAASMMIVDSYELAREIETAITESYKDIKATQTAIERKMSFEAAQQITDVAKAVRMEANREAIEASPRTKEALDAQKVAQAEIVREADSIVETAVAMMQEAMEIVQPDDGSKSEVAAGCQREIPWLQEKDFAERAQEERRQERLAQMSAAADYQVAISAAAAESESERAKDLTRVMAGAVEGKKDVEPASGVEGRKFTGEEFVAEKLTPLKSRMPELLPGNVIRFTESAAKDGLPGKWMYVQDWYVIGPFPNPNRVNLRRKFPPESVVDLDATYVGKDGKTIRWEFMQTRNTTPVETWRVDGKAELVPYNAEEYGIWYAYAEVFTDVACDCWIAVGSDDRSDIWLNDVPVWGSSNKLKSWRVDEGYRKIHLNKGRNRILARIENGWHALGWSVCLSLDEGAPF
ncbi:MAG: hypothetical protein IJ146_11320 [Kiritimatiellae bacterium]|nr:hypothetical protein [Kiritimatiellia bacterium]